MKKTIFTSLLLLFTFTLFAQNNSVKDLPALDKKRFYIGGNGGLSFGSITYIEVAPLLGYRVTDRLSTGIQPSFSFLKYKLYDYYGNYTGRKVSAYYYGGGLYGRFYILDNVFAHAQYEINNLEAAIANDPINPTYFTYKRINVPSLLLGGGYRQPIGQNSGITIQILYDVLQRPYSPYSRNPVIRAGINFGF